MTGFLSGWRWLGWLITLGWIGAAFFSNFVLPTPA
jgi:hypothetical protein